MNLNTIDFFGFKVSIFTEEELEGALLNTVTSENSKVYYGYSMAVLIYLKKYPEYYSVVNNFDVIVTDGRIFYLLAKIFGFRLKDNISIPQLTLKALRLANEKELRVMLIGATDESNIKAYSYLKNTYPEITLCTGRNGYFSEEDNPEVFNLIKKNKPQLLLLGMPTPKKQFLAAEIKQIINGCIIIPCGGMIDVLSGEEKLTPGWIKKLGFASLFRHIQHPVRLYELFQIYFLTLKVFIICLILKFIKRKRNISIPEIISKSNYTK